MKRIMMLGLLVVCGFGGVHALLNAASAASSSKPRRSPSAILADVETNAVKGSAHTVFSTKQGVRGSFLSVAPNRKLLCYFRRYDNGKKWELGIVDPSQPDRAIKYAGSASNGFCLTQVVWSPQSSEVALALGYNWTGTRWIRVGTAKSDSGFAKTCADMASIPDSEVEELTLKGGSVDMPVWGANGQFYRGQWLARKDGVVKCQPWETSPVYDSATRAGLFIGDDAYDEAYTVLVDNSARMAHAFKNDRYVESFPVAGQIVNGWWLLSRPEGRLIAARRFKVHIERKRSPTGKLGPLIPAQLRWVAVDLGAGRINYVYKMERGILIRLTKDNVVKAVFIDDFAVRASLRPQ